MNFIFHFCSLEKHAAIEHQRVLGYPFCIFLLGRHRLFVACQPFPEGGLVFLAVARFVELASVLVVAPVVVYHLIDGAPVGEGAHVAVVDIHVGTYLPAWGGEGGGLLVGVVGIDGIELQAAPATVVDSLL